jgi:hypothetical protein
MGGGDVALGRAGSDMRAEAGTLCLTTVAVVLGNLTYASDRPAEIASGVVVAGEINPPLNSWVDASPPATSGHWHPRT